MAARAVRWFGVRIATKTALAFAAFAAACVGGSGLLLIEEFERVLLEGLEDRQRLLVQNRALVLSENLGLARGELERISRMEEIDLEDDDLRPEQRLLAQAYQQTSFFNERLELYSARGRCRWAEPSHGDCVEPEVLNEPWFRAALEGPNTGVYVRERGGHGHVDLVSAVRRDGRVVGVLRGVVDLHHDLMFSPALHDELEPLPQIALVTSDRHTAIRSEEGSLADAAWDEGLSALRYGGSGASLVDASNETLLVAWTPVEGADLGLIFAWPLEQLDDAAEQQIRNLSLSITVVGALALLIGFVVARLLTQPLQGLVTHLRSLQARTIAVLPTTDRDDEVGDVQRAFGALLSTLEEREQEIRDDRDRIAELASELEARVEERTRELRDMQDALLRAERMAAIGRAGTVLSHELRNSLNAVSIAIDTLGTDASAESHHTARRLVRGEIARLRKLSDDLLRYAREPVIERTRVRVSELLEDARLLSEDHAKEHGVRIVNDPIEPELFIDVDVDRMHTVLVNLVRNGVEAAEGSQSAEVRLAAHELGDAVEVWIEDSGAGVASEIRERLFQPFMTTRRQGLGLGLAIAERFVRAHGGSMALSDGALGGARFVIRLSAHDDDDDDDEGEDA